MVAFKRTTTNSTTGSFGVACIELSYLNDDSYSCYYHGSHWQDNCFWGVGGTRCSNQISY
jgi:hypothetical protein